MAPRGKPKLLGTKEMAARLRKLADKYPDRMRAALQFRAELIMTTSKRDFVPVNLNSLRSSGHVLPPERGKGREISVTLVYGGPSEPYALAVHETPSGHDPPSWKGVAVTFAVGGPKYLERPLLNAIPTLGRDLARDLKLERGFR